MTSFMANRAWLRAPENPILKPFPDNPLGESICMNPSVLIHNETCYLFYAADDCNGKRTIRLATAPASDPTSLHDRGIMVENGKPGAFDAAWCVLPQIVEIGPGTWYMYYTGNQGFGEGLSAFSGMGMAVSHDLIHWEKYSDYPVVTPDDEPGIGKAAGIAGGSFLTDLEPDGSMTIRLYYTVCPSMGNDVFLDQQKRIHYAESPDGIHWTKRGCILERDPRQDYENIAVAGPVVRKEEHHYEMFYSAIGTRWGFYSICYAESNDGFHWYRGEAYGENLQLGPFTSGLRGDCRPQTWDSQMAAYPAVVKENDYDRLFYTGNGYGEGGIGTAISTPIRAAAAGKQDGALKLWHPAISGCKKALLMKQIKCGGTDCRVRWFSHGIQHNGDIWMEWGLDTSQGRHLFGCRFLIFHNSEGLEIRCTVMNPHNSTLDHVSLDIKMPGNYRCVWSEETPQEQSVPAFQAITLSGRIQYQT